MGIVSFSSHRWMAFCRLPSGRDCPLLQVLAGMVVQEELEVSLPWIISWLLEGSNYAVFFFAWTLNVGWGWGRESVGFFGKL